MGVPVATITRQRLQDWGADCIRDHATPALLLAIGHGQAAGEVHVYVPDDPLFDRHALRRLLLRAVRQLEDG